MELTTDILPPFLNILINFDTFSRLPPNTSIYLNSKGYFAITARAMSYFPGAQTMSNYYNSHTIEKLVEDLGDFSKKIDEVLKPELEKINNIKTKLVDLNEAIRIISLLCKEFKFAYNGITDTFDSGMCGLLSTFEKDPCLPSLIIVLENMKKMMCKYKKAVENISYEQIINTLHCPETDFTDEDWMQMLKIVPLLQKEHTGFCKKLFSGSDNSYNEICQFANGSGIYLGGLPMIGFKQNDLTILKEIGITAVLSVVEIFENNSSGYIYSPVTAQNWRDDGIKYHYQIPCPNYCPMELELVQKGVEFIHWNIRNKRKIYVHCDYGLNRSFVVIVAYFVEYYSHTVTSAIEYITSRRPGVYINPNSKNMILLNKIESLVRIKNFKVSQK